MRNCEVDPHIFETVVDVGVVYQRDDNGNKTAG